METAAAWRAVVVKFNGCGVSGTDIGSHEPVDH